MRLIFHGITLVTAAAVVAFVAVVVVVVVVAVERTPFARLGSGRRRNRSRGWRRCRWRRERLDVRIEV
jgi:hypothetical protein